MGTGNEKESRIILRGMLLSWKAMTEYTLHSGDPRTDFNEANMLLEKCVTDPQWYATHTAAQCQSMQHQNISLETQMDFIENLHR